MLSFKAKAVWSLFRYGHILKGKIKRPPFDSSPEGVKKLREQVETGGKKFGKFPNDLNVVPIEINNIYAEWIEHKNQSKEKVILYFHGGMYTCGSPQSHRNHVAKFVKGTNLPALVFDYRLAPENPFPAALDDAITSYKYLLRLGTKAKDIVFIGDSAGGGLCLATLLAIRDKGMELPSCSVAISPWLDLTLSGKSYQTNKNVCLSPIGCAEAVSQFYCKTEDRTNPYISPLFGNLEGLTPIYITVGSEEIMTDDSIRFIEKAKTSGVDASLTVGEGLFHCWPMCAPMFPEATREIENIFKFVKKNVNT